jgi:4-hydroxyphenylpyruvate dioxygenase
MHMTQSYAKEGESKVGNIKLENPIGLDGMEFIEYGTPNPEAMEALFLNLGFKKTGEHLSKPISLWSQGRIHFILNKSPDSFAAEFSRGHGPSVCATGFRVKDAKHAFTEAVKRGARPCEASPKHTFPAVYGIGDSVIYFIDGYSQADRYKVFRKDFKILDESVHQGFQLETIDHLTNNVPQGEMQKWCDFYRNIFGFREVRYFDIKGKATGLISKVMRSPCDKIIIPINEPSDKKSQIQEYLDEYHGSGIQHIALLTNDIVASVRALKSRGLEFLHAPDTYYEKINARVPNVTEDIETLKELKILVDGDDGGYLLQIFTQTVIGPIFYEIIERKGHQGFGEGNFQALFDSIEEDQRRRGYL